MITRENFVRLRTYRNNIQRYRELLETSLTDFERQFIERRLSEEQLAIETLAAKILPNIAEHPIAPATMAQRLAAARRNTPGLTKPT